MQVVDYLTRVFIVSGDQVHIALQHTIRAKAVDGKSIEVIRAKARRPRISRRRKAADIGRYPRDEDRQSHITVVDERRPLLWGVREWTPVGQ